MLAGIVQASDFQDKLRLRASHPALSAVASESVSTLRTTLDLELPARAWQVFSSASGLRVEPPGWEDKLLGCEGSNSCRMLTAAALERCGRVLEALPARVQRVHLLSSKTYSCGATFLPHPAFTAQQDELLNIYYETLVEYEPRDEYFLSLINHGQRQEMDRQSRASSQQLAAALGRSPAAAHLTELLVDWEMLPAGAEQLLRACPALERLRLAVAAWLWEKDEQWSPPLPSGLTSLELCAKVDHHSEWCSAPVLSPTALAPLTRLQHLWIEEMEPAALAEGSSGWASLLGSLTALRSLQLDFPCSGGWGLSDALTELAPLQQLSSLRLEGHAIELETWATLAQLPRLAALHVYSMQLPELATGAPLAALASLQADILAQGAAPGGLCALLPSLHQLTIFGWLVPGCFSVMQLLRGHPELCTVHLSGHRRESGWPEPVLASLPRLQHFELRAGVEGTTFRTGADALLADLAACSSLRSIALGPCHSSSINISGAGVRALAAAASSATLERIVLNAGLEWHNGERKSVYAPAGRVALADALPLLQARMPRLRELRLPVLGVAEEELRAVALQLGRPLEVLRAQLALDVPGVP
jgi:hypothetical protein